MSKNLTELERLRDEEDSGIINVTVDGKYRLIERMSMATPQYRLEDENGHRVPLNEIDYHDWVTDNFGELFDSYGDLRYDMYGEYPIDDVCDRLEDYHTLSLWYDN